MATRPGIRRVRAQALECDLGDRHQELVFIGGPEMDEASIREALDVCLHGTAITGVSKAHAKLGDPFPLGGLRIGIFAADMPDPRDCQRS